MILYCSSQDLVLERKKFIHCITLRHDAFHVPLVDVEMCTICFSGVVGMCVVSHSKLKVGISGM